MDNVNLLLQSVEPVKQGAEPAKANNTKGAKDDFNHILKSNTNDSTNSTKDASTEKAKNNTNEKIVKKAKSKEAVVSTENEDKEIKEVVDDQILALIGTMMQIPVETVQEVLVQMGCEATDLLNQATFTEFINTLYTGMGENPLLLDQESLKNVSKLFSKLEQISTVIEENVGELIVQETLINHEEKVSGEIVKTEVTLIQAATTEQNLAPLETAELGEVMSEHKVEPIKQDEEAISDLKVEDHLNSKSLGLGMNIPIQAFDSTIQTKLWNNELSYTEISQTIKDNSIVSQMIDKVEVKALKDYQEVTMQLSPRELGNLSIKLTQTNGVLVADIKVDNEKAKEMLLSQVSELEKSLADQGLSVGEVRVDVGQNPHQSHMQKEQQKSTRRVQELLQKHFYEEEINTEDEPVKVMQETEVDYMV